MNEKYFGIICKQRMIKNCRIRKEKTKRKTQRKKENIIVMKRKSLLKDKF